MELMEMGKQELKGVLEMNHTRPERIAAIMKGIGRKQLRTACDDAYTVLVCGSNVGVAKRAESGVKRDEPNLVVGLCIAVSRLK